MNKIKAKDVSTCFYCFHILLSWESTLNIFLGVEGRLMGVENYGRSNEKNFIHPVARCVDYPGDITVVWMNT